MSLETYKGHIRGMSAVYRSSIGDSLLSDPDCIAAQAAGDPFREGGKGGVGKGGVGTTNNRGAAAPPDPPAPRRFVGL